MADLYPTKTRLQFLRLVRDGDVRRGSFGTDYAMPDYRKVNARCTEAARAGWIALPFPQTNGIAWVLTAKGASLLDRVEASNG